MKGSANGPQAGCCEYSPKSEVERTFTFAARQTETHSTAEPHHTNVSESCAASDCKAMVRFLAEK
jgi:hypothetical protein